VLSFADFFVSFHCSRAAALQIPANQTPTVVVTWRAGESHVVDLCNSASCCFVDACFAVLGRGVPRLDQCVRSPPGTASRRARAAFYACLSLPPLPLTTDSITDEALVCLGAVCAEAVICAARMSNCLVYTRINTEQRLCARCSLVSQLQSKRVYDTKRSGASLSGASSAPIVLRTEERAMRSTL